MHCALSLPNTECQSPQSQFQPLMGHVAPSMFRRPAQVASLSHRNCVHRPWTMLIGLVMPAWRKCSWQLHMPAVKFQLPRPQSVCPQPKPSGVSIG